MKEDGSGWKPELEGSMGATAFAADPDGNVEIARTVARERFYEILFETLRGASAPDG